MRNLTFVIWWNNILSGEVREKKPDHCTMRAKLLTKKLKKIMRPYVDNTGHGLLSKNNIHNYEYDYGAVS